MHVLISYPGTHMSQSFAMHSCDKNTSAEIAMQACMHLQAHAPMSLPCTYRHVLSIRGVTHV